MDDILKYIVGDWLASDNSVLLRVAAVLEGACDIYGVVGITGAEDIAWYTEQELEHEKLVKVDPDLHRFRGIKVGDFVKMGDAPVKVLYVTGNLVLLSQSKHKNPRLMMADLMETLSGEEILDDEDREHYETHETAGYAYSAAGQWYDIDYMALMNWKLISE